MKPTLTVLFPQPLHTPSANTSTSKYILNLWPFHVYYLSSPSHLHCLSGLINVLVSWLLLFVFWVKVRLLYSPRLAWNTQSSCHFLQMLGLQIRVTMPSCTGFLYGYTTTQPHPICHTLAGRPWLRGWWDGLMDTALPGKLMAPTLNPTLRWQRKVNLSSQVYIVPSQPGLYKETLSQKSKTNQSNKLLNEWNLSLPHVSPSYSVLLKKKIFLNKRQRQNGVSFGSGWPLTHCVTEGGLNYPAPQISGALHNPRLMRSWESNPGPHPC